MKLYGSTRCCELWTLQMSPDHNPGIPPVPQSRRPIENSVRAAVSANPDSAKSKNAETAKTVDEPFAPLGATTSVRSTQASAR